MSAAFEIAGLDAVGQADLVRRGDVSAVELVTWAIERTNRGPQSNAQRGRYTDF
jgi:hypothetical protein